MTPAEGNDPPQKKKKPRRAAPKPSQDEPASHAPRIIGVILALNEEKRIRGAIECLAGWTHRVIVIDNSSTDSTAAIAESLGALVISAPRAKNFDALRMLALDHADGDWIYFLDCDERVPKHLAELFVRIVKEQGDEITSVTAPFKTYFCGKWMQHSNWWPGYTRPQLLKKGFFHYNERLHSGVNVEGKGIILPPEEQFGIDHFSYDDLNLWISKFSICFRSHLAKSAL